MARGLADRADRRAAEVLAAVRDLLSQGNHRAALHKAWNALLGEAAKVRQRRPGAGALTDAELAASLAALAAQLHAHKPWKPPGCPAVPQPAHLLAVFDRTYASAAGEAAQ